MHHFCGVNIYKEITFMTNYCDILRLHRLGLNKTEIASNNQCARNTVVTML